MEPAARFLLSRPDEGGGGGGAEDQNRISHLDHEEDDDEQEAEVPYILDIFVHEARGIHNICIYGDQDVYAKLALTSDDVAAAVSTRVARGGGAAPRFAERLRPLRVPRGRLAVDVLKCELWMRSCASGVLDDQLLGFALVPLADVVAADGATVVEGEFELSSTDLLHSPAGTVSLSLALRPGGIHEDDATERGADAEPSIASEVVILAPVDYSRIEFTDLRVEQENDAMAVQYLPFLRTTGGETVVVAEDDCEMSTNPGGEKSGAAAAASSDGSTSCRNTAAASTASTVSEDRAAVSSSGEAAERPLLPNDVDEASTAPVLSRSSPDTPTSRGGKATSKAGGVFTSPLGDTDMDMDIGMEAEQSAMQRQIMEMYVKSMQQFSESLAKMQLPIELLGLDADGGGGVVQKEETPDNNHNKVIERQQAKKDGSRVFYGSRAFF